MAEPTAAGREAHLLASDEALLRMRRFMTKPPGNVLPVPGLDRGVDYAKTMACEAVGALGARGALATVKEVAAYLTLDPSTVSRLLGEAEAEGLVVREHDEGDRRRTVVRLTADGEHVVRVTQRIRLAFIGEVTADWSDRELAIFSRLLGELSERVTERLGQLCDGQVPAELVRAYERACAELLVPVPDGLARAD
jgi:DNA-binding MarR family transcriptional regulator